MIWTTYSSTYDISNLSYQKIHMSIISNWIYCNGIWKCKLFLKNKFSQEDRIVFNIIIYHVIGVQTLENKNKHKFIKNLKNKNSLILCKMAIIITFNRPVSKRPNNRAQVLK